MSLSSVARRGHHLSQSERRYCRVPGREAGQVRGFEKAGEAKENRFDFVRPGAQGLQRQPLREEGEREFVLFIAKRRGDLLVKRFIFAMQFGEPLQPLHFALETELRCRVENAANFFLRLSAQRRMAAAGAGQRRTGRNTSAQDGRIDSHLRDLPVGRCPGEELASTGRDENVQHNIVEGRIGRMAVRFPALIGEIELDAPAQKFLRD